jgi:hypothetical protein
VAACLDAQHAEARLGIVEGHPLHQSGQGLVGVEGTAAVAMFLQGSGREC